MPKIIIMTSAIGGGHVFRDLAIAKELKKILSPDYEFIFASGGNAYEMLQEEGAVVEKISALDFPVHLGTADFFKFYFLMLWAEFLQTLDLRKLIKKHQPALVILDEYFFLTDYCRLRGIPVVFICDFVGLPRHPFFSNPLRSLLERFFDFVLTHWLARRADRWIFTGDIDHIPRGDWQARVQNLGIVIVEPITKLQYTPPPKRTEARKKLGFGDGERVVSVTVGCAGVGEYLLSAANEAADLLIKKVPGLRMELFCGKGIDAATLRRNAKPGVRVHDYVRNLEEFIAASDAAVVQGGLTSTIECLMMGVPMIIVPLSNHWEQGNTARYVSEKFGVKVIEASEVSAELLADGLFELLYEPARFISRFRGDGHIAAAKAIAAVLTGPTPRSSPGY